MEVPEKSRDVGGRAAVVVLKELQNKGLTFSPGATARKVEREHSFDTETGTVDCALEEISCDSPT